MIYDIYDMDIFIYILSISMCCKDIASEFHFLMCVKCVHRKKNEGYFISSHLTTL